MAEDGDHPGDHVGVEADPDDAHEEGDREPLGARLRIGDGQAQDELDGPEVEEEGLRPEGSLRDLPRGVFLFCGFDFFLVFDVFFDGFVVVEREGVDHYDVVVVVVDDSVDGHLLLFFFRLLCFPPVHEILHHLRNASVLKHDTEVDEVGDEQHQPLIPKDRRIPRHRD